MSTNIHIAVTIRESPWTNTFSQFIIKIREDVTYLIFASDYFSYK